MILTKTTMFLKSLVTKLSNRRNKQAEQSRAFAELLGSVKEAEQTQRHERLACRKFVVKLGKPVEVVGELKRYNLDLPALINGDKVEIITDVEHSCDHDVEYCKENRGSTGCNLAMSRTEQPAQIID